MLKYEMGITRQNSKLFGAIWFLTNVVLTQAHTSTITTHPEKAHPPSCHAEARSGHDKTKQYAVRSRMPLTNGD
jgi:hypothetical protein